MILKSWDDKRPVVTQNSSMGENTHGDLIEGAGDYVQGRNIELKSYFKFKWNSHNWLGAGSEPWVILLIFQDLSLMILIKIIVIKKTCTQAMTHCMESQLHEPPPYHTEGKSWRVFQINPLAPLTPKFHYHSLTIKLNTIMNHIPIFSNFWALPSRQHNMHINYIRKL